MMGDYFSPMTLDELIGQSLASRPFKEEVRRYVLGERVERIQVIRASPRIKVLRLISQVLAEEPSLEIEEVVVDAWSGCSDFWGRVVVATKEATPVYRFRWDCSWRAVEQGWYDGFQFPDQIRAAREFDWRCFVMWERQVDAAPDADTEPLL